MVLGQAQKALYSQASIDQRMIRSGMQRLVQRQRLARQQSNRFLPLDVDGTAQFNNGEFRLNGDFFALASVEEQSAEVVSTGTFNFVSDPDGNFSGYFNGRTALKEVAENYTDLARYPRAKVMALKPAKLCYEQAKEICRRPKL